MIEMLEGNAFHLATDGTSYVICITDTGHAEHIYYGKKLRDVRASLTAIFELLQVIAVCNKYQDVFAMEVEQ